MGYSHVDVLDALLLGAKRTPSEYKIALSRLLVEIRERAARGSPESYDFFTSTVRTLAKIKGSANADLRLSCLFDSVCYLYRAGFPAAALEASKATLKLATEARNKPWLRKASTVAGMVNADQGDVAEAIVQHTNALIVARDLYDREGEAIAVVNIGVSLLYGGVYREAVFCFQKAIAMMLADPALNKLLGNAYCNLAQCYLALEQFVEGLDTIRRSLASSNEPSDAATAFSRTIREFTYVQLALELGDFVLAREHSALCRQFSQWGHHSRSRVMADIAEGLCEVHSGNVEYGLSLLERSLENTSNLAASSHVDALVALVKANEVLGRPQRALDYMRYLLAHVRSLREKSIQGLLSIAGHNVEMAQRASYSGDLRPLEAREAKLRAKAAEIEVVSAQLEMLERLAVTADLKEDASGEHGYRVGRLSALLAERFGWNRDACNAIEQAARLHDIGKIGIPDRILLTSQELKDAERHLMSAHTLIGAELLAKSDVPQLRVAEEIAKFHHEWWDGSGYPKKLAGSRIPVHARIVALADVFDALTHGRSYAEPWPVQRAVDEIKGRKGTQFDPELTDHFLALVERLRVDHPNLDEYLGRAGRYSPFLQARRKIRALLTEEEAYVAPHGTSEGAVLQ